jgi:hypothetical protein
MPIVPTGTPAWTRTASIEDYGGNTEKANYLGGGAINPLTDVDAREFSRMTADLAAVVRTAPFLVATYSADDTSPASPIVEFIWMMTGRVAGPFSGTSPPAGFPTFAYNGDGVVLITFASSYSDEYGVAAAFAPTGGVASCRGSGVGGRNVKVQPSGQTVTVTVLDEAGVAAMDQTITVEIF